MVRRKENVRIRKVSNAMDGDVHGVKNDGTTDLVLMALIMNHK